ncbi:MAG: hypothetical protein P8177_12185 [Gemmatimonadota bacterium]|jgi:hypothetical protein
MTKLILMLAIAGSAVAFVPQPAAAAACTDGYVKCLNDSYYLTGVLQKMSDVDCFAEYVGCVRRSLLGL